MVVMGASYIASEVYAVAYGLGKPLTGPVGALVAVSPILGILIEMFASVDTDVNRIGFNMPATRGILYGIPLILAYHRHAPYWRIGLSAAAFVLIATRMVMVMVAAWRRVRISAERGV